MIRVLHVLGTVGLGGAESRVMDLYRHMDREKIQFDFLVTEGTDDHYRTEIETMGGRVYHLPAFRMVNIAEYRRACVSFFSEHANEYAAVHGHMTSTAAIYLPIAKKYGAKLAIGHARSAGVDPGLKGMATRFMRRNLYKYCDIMLTCSDEAGDSVFGKGRDFVFMPNAIDMAEYAYSEDSRKKTRSEYGIGDDEILIGHVGSFRYAKNHEFIIDIMKTLFDGNGTYRLMLVGDGSLRKDIEAKVSSCGLSDKVIFTGNQSPVAPYYSAFDVLLFPSHYEGMPGTVVEAQASGLPCLISDAITPQVIFTDRVIVKSLSESADIWADSLREIVSKTWSRSDVKTLDGSDLSDTIYDVNKQVEYYTELYTV